MKNDARRLLFIGGGFVEAAQGGARVTHNPATGEPLAEVAWGTAEDADRAVRAARKAFDDGRWSGLPLEKRKAILFALANRVSERAREWAEIESNDSGGVIWKTLSDITLGLEDWKTFLSLADSAFAEQAPALRRPASAASYVAYEPIGVCAQIIPWNFPLLMAIWKIVPALLAGNTVVLKPAPQTPLTALELAGLIERSGIPPGVVNVITGDAEVGRAMVAHADVDKIAFTGSTRVGRSIMELAANDVKRLTLELGGKSPNIVLEDADPDVAVDGALFAGFYHQGQVCTAGSRLLIHTSIYKSFIDRLVERARQIRLGPPLDFGTGMGPLISAEHRERVEQYVDTGRIENARLACGGKRPRGESLRMGAYYEPTIFIDVDPRMRIAREEIFGPVLSVMPFKDEDEAVRLANDTIYGLAAGIWSRDVPRAIELGRRVRAGTVWINEFHLLNPMAPFGGYRQSGIGRELGIPGLRAYAETKHLYVDLGGARETRTWYDPLVPPRAS